MIKKAIAYIEGFCKDVKTDMSRDPYTHGSKDVADNVLTGLEGLEKLYSVYELNPYATGSDRWEEISCSSDPESARDIAEALSRYHAGQIDIRYEASNNSVYEIRKEGDHYRHFRLEDVE